MTRVFPNALTFRTVLGIDTSSTAVPTIKVAAFKICLIIAEAISYSCICDFVSVSSFAFAFCAEFSIDTGSTAVPPIKRTMSIVVVILAKTVPNQCSELTVYIWWVREMFGCTCKYFGGFFEIISYLLWCIQRLCLELELPQNFVLELRVPCPIMLSCNFCWNKSLSKSWLDFCICSSLQVLLVLFLISPLSEILVSLAVMVLKFEKMFELINK